jgi:hypothetical protein
MDVAALTRPMVRLYPTLLSDLPHRPQTNVLPRILCAASTPRDVYIVDGTPDIYGSPPHANEVYRYSVDKNTLTVLQCSGDKPSERRGSGVIIGQFLVFVLSPSQYNHVYVLNLGMYLSYLTLRVHMFHLLLQLPTDGPDFLIRSKARRRRLLANWLLSEKCFCCLDKMGITSQRKNFGHSISTKVRTG